MYGVVLMAALTVVPTTPGWGHRGCGCWGSGYWGSGYSCYGCYGNWWGVGGWGYGCGGCWGSSGYSCCGCWGGYSYAPCGCCGYSYAPCGCYGSTWGGGMGAWGGGYGYVEGGAPMTGPGMGAVGGGPEQVGPPVGGTRPGAGAPGPGGGPGTGPGAPPRGGVRTPPAGAGGPGGPGGPGGTTSLPGVGSAQIVVQLPVGAKLYVDDHLMRTPTGKRTFTTPRLDNGQAYYYILRAEVVRDGKVQREQKRVIIRAGDVVKATFDDLNAERTVKATAAH